MKQSSKNTPVKQELSHARGVTEERFLEAEVYGDPKKGSLRT